MSHPFIFRPSIVLLSTGLALLHMTPGLANHSSRLLLQPVVASTDGVLPSLLATQALLPTQSRANLGAIAQSTSPSPATDDVLRLGNKGEQVRDLQVMLARLGYFNAPADGIFGPQTRAAVFEFQKAMGITATGQVGPRTRQRLQEIRATMPSPQPTVTPQASPSPTASAPTPSPTTSPPPSPTGDADDPVLPATAPVASDPAAATTTPTTVVSPTTPQSNRVGWVLVGLLALLGVIFSVLYLRQRYRLQNAMLARKSSAQLPEGATNFTATGATEVMTPIQGSQYRHADVLTPMSSETAIAPSSPTAKSGETTRLARIDIREELVQELHSPDPVKRRKAIWDLGQQGDSQAIQPLVDLLIDSDSSQRSLILAAISEINIRALKPMNRALITSLQDENPDVRKNAIRDVTRVYEMMVQTSQILSHAATDPDPEVQETAQWALSQLSRIRMAAETHPTLLTASSMEALPSGEGSVEGSPDDASATS